MKYVYSSRNKIKLNCTLHLLLDFTHIANDTTIQI